jgi:integrase
MRGHIVKRSKNSYSMAISLGRDAATGKYAYHWTTVKGTKKEAEKRLSELLNQIDNGIFMKPAKITLGEYLEIWLKDYARPNLAPRTAEGYESIIYRHLIPRLGRLRLTQLKPEHLQRYYSDKLSSGRYDGKGALSQTTVNHHHTCLHRALKMALKWGLINRNPADAVTPPQPRSGEMHTMDESEIRTFLDFARRTPYYVLFYLLLFTGMRRSELLALRWCDVDLDLCVVSVLRSLHRLRDGSLVFQQPKTAKARRMIDLTPSSALELKEFREKQKTECLILGTTLTDDELIFRRSDGKPMLPDTISHAWVKITKQAGLKHFRLHDGRHTHASIMLKQGIHPKVVQERLGHATISTTLDLYSHVAPGIQAAAALRFDEALSPKYNKTGVEREHKNGLEEKIH